MKKYLLLLLLSSATVFAADFEHSGATFSIGDTGYVPTGAGTTITQSNDLSTITALNSVACPGDNDSYFRRFDLNGAHGIVDEFNISSVDFATEAMGTITSLDITVNLYSIANADALVLANLTLVGTGSINVPNPNPTMYNALVAGVVNGSTHDLVVEIVSNDFSNGGSYFIGSNANGQTGPSFILAPVCGASEPTDLATIGFAGMHIIMAVNGQVGPPPVIPTLSQYGIMLLLLMVFGFVGRRLIAK